MSDTTLKAANSFMRGLKRRNPGQREFHQAVQELVHSVMPVVLDEPRYQHAQILERLTEPDRVVSFRVCWEDDARNLRTDRGWRVQFNNSIGPYKGGLRFHKNVNLSILKFLGFEQIFKNALTTLPMGGAKGGASFNPKGKTDSEVMRFCHSFMLELSKHIGPSIDVPAGDIGVGKREIGYLFGQYKRICNEWTGTMTGKGLEYGGSLIRPEATGYGAVYFAHEMLGTRGEDLSGKLCSISGSGNVAQFAAQKLIEYDAKVVTMSDSGGFIHDPDGINTEKLAFIMDLKENRRGRIHEYAEKFGCEFYAEKRPWSVPVDVAFPCATQNELDGDDARTLVANNVTAISEGANMPTNPEGVDIFLDAKVLYGPGKAANAGGVAVSGLEQSQNSLRMTWTRDHVDQQLKDIMTNIHTQCATHGKEGDFVDYVKGANIAGFLKVAEAMVAFGPV